MKEELMNLLDDEDVRLKIRSIVRNEDDLQSEEPVEEFKPSVEDLQAVLDLRDAEIERLNDELVAKGEKIERLNSEMKNQRAELEQQHLNEISRLQAMLDLRDAEIERLNDELVGTNAELKLLKSELKSNEELERRAEELHAELNAAMSDAARERQEIYRLNKENGALRRQLEKLQSINANQLP